jgi:hypothetical protein
MNALDSDEGSWTMEAVRRPDATIKGFYVGKDCPY